MTPAWLLALLLAGCATSTPETTAACHAERVAEVPILLRQGALLVPARIAGAPVTMLLDTGAERSMISPAEAAAARLSVIRGRTTIIVGTGGQVAAPTVLLHGLEFGRFEFPAAPAAVAELPAGFSANPPVAGVIGGEVLSSFDLDFDFPNRRLTLWTVQNCNENFTPIKTSHSTVALLRTRSHRFLLPVELDGHRVQALFDTGANASRITRDAALAAGVPPEALAHDLPVRGAGAGALAFRGVNHHFDSVTIGGAIFHDIPVSVVDLPIAEATMLLGIDYMQHRRIWLSYATHRAFIASP